MEGTMKTQLKTNKKPLVGGILLHKRAGALLLILSMIDSERQRYRESDHTAASYLISSNLFVNLIKPSPAPPATHERRRCDGGTEGKQSNILIKY